MDQLLALLDRLVDAGNTVIVIEHQAVMAHADWIIGREPGAGSRGPGAGGDGGEVVFTGTVAELMDKGETLTAKHLRQCVGAAGWALKSIPPMA